MNPLRSLRTFMDSKRSKRLLSPCDLSRLGLEIGASFHPIAPKAKGYKVETLDHLSQEELKAKYAEAPGADLDRIEAVDHVWDGRPYAQLVGAEGRYGWIIAAHMIEHVPDLLGFLKDCHSILEPGGVLALAVPDRRFTFDARRPESAIGQVVDAHLRRDSQPSAGNLIELHLRSVRKGKRINWRPYHLGPLHPIHDPATARSEYARILASSEYEDSHVWSFTPGSFELLIKELRLIGELELELVAVKPRWGLEFLAWLKKPV